MDLCDPNPCLQGAPCHSVGGTYMCTCPDGYHGNECVSLKSPCTGQHCSGTERFDSFFIQMSFSLLFKFSEYFSLTPFFSLHAYRRHVRLDPPSGPLLHHPRGHGGVGSGVRLRLLHLRRLPPPPQAEEAAGRPARRRHQQPEGDRQPDSKRGPSRAPPAPRPLASARSPRSRRCPAMLRGDRTDPPAVPGAFAPVSGAEAGPRPQTGHFKQGEGETEHFSLYREPRTGSLTFELWGSLRSCVLCTFPGHRDLFLASCTVAVIRTRRPDDT